MTRDSRPLFGCLALTFLLSSRAHAGATLRWQELNREHGNPVQTTAVAYSGEAGLRIDISETGGSAGPTQMTFLYLSSNHTLYIRRGREEWLALSPDILERVRRSAPPAPVDKVVVSPTHTRHAFAGFACEGYQLKQRGLPSRIVCLGNPADLRLDELTQHNFRDFSRILTVFMSAAAAKGEPARGKDAHIRFNTYDMSGGFPVREWESRNGDIWMDSQLVDITAGQPPASLFQRPLP